jgi:tight adherence protein C
MRFEYSIPILISLIALVIADEESRILERFQNKVFKIRDHTGVRKRLVELDKSSEDSFENFRIYQFTLAGAGLFSASILLLFQLIGFSSWILLNCFLFAIVIVVTERGLNKRIALKRRTIESEFPAVIEMLTLSIGAGESAPSAIRRIATRADGYLARDFALVISDIERGKPFHIALDALSKKHASNSVRRFTDSLIISLSRGTPLIETLVHSAQEARSTEKVHLLAAAGKSEIAMMIPVVFLILPISILFALFPSLASLQLISA